MAPKRKLQHGEIGRRQRRVWGRENPDQYREEEARRRSMRRYWRNVRRNQAAIRREQYTIPKIQRWFRAARFRKLMNMNRRDRMGTRIANWVNFRRRAAVRENTRLAEDLAIMIGQQPSHIEHADIFENTGYTNFQPRSIRFGNSRLRSLMPFVRTPDSRMVAFNIDPRYDFYNLSAEGGPRGPRVSYD